MSIHDTHAIPAHDDADRDLCADENCGECGTDQPQNATDIPRTSPTGDPS